MTYLGSELSSLVIFRKSVCRIREPLRVFVSVLSPIFIGAVLFISSTIVFTVIEPVPPGLSAPIGDANIYVYAILYAELFITVAAIVAIGELVLTFVGCLSRPTILPI